MLRVRARNAIRDMPQRMFPFVNGGLNPFGLDPPL